MNSDNGVEDDLSLIDVLVQVNHDEGQHHGEEGDSLKTLFAPLMNSDNRVEDDGEATTRTKGSKVPKAGTGTNESKKKCKKDKDKGRKGNDDEGDKGCEEGEKVISPPSRFLLTPPSRSPRFYIDWGVTRYGLDWRQDT